MKFLKICFIALIIAFVFSACERQGEVINIMDGTPSNADTVLPRKFKNQQKSDSIKKVAEENVAPVYRR